MKRTLVGVFVGGRSRRMGSPKGLLQAPDGSFTLLERLLSVTRGAVSNAEIVLMGNEPAYARTAVRQVPDAVLGVGPIGGLLALARLGRTRACRTVLALACDMPYVSTDLVARLARICPNQPNLAPRVGAHWQPFFARYEAEATEAAIAALLARGRRSMSSVLDTLRARPLPLSPREAWQLTDWDTPDDVRARPPRG